MNLSPIPRVLSTFRNAKVRALLMGGQACILYGAAEFSRDVDFVIAVSPRNLARLRAALDELDAEPVFFPPMSEDTLGRGHACHFRCLGTGLHRLRIDVMSKMRGVDPFPALWRRRECIRLPGIGIVDVLALPDLVSAKRTQRDKDWPMIRRLVEADILRAPAGPPAGRVRFWLCECRTADVLVGLAGRYPRAARRLGAQRPLLRVAVAGDRAAVERGILAEQEREREADRIYWKPLRAELERLRAAARRGLEP